LKSEEDSRRVWIITEAEAYEGELSLPPVIEPSYEYFDATKSKDGVYVSLCAFCKDDTKPLTDAQRLAVSVLQGDEEAAFVLADEVLANFHSPKDFRSNKDLRQKSENLWRYLDEALSYSETLRKELAEYRKVDPNPNSRVMT
jgi:hypothetical protein